MFIPKVVCSRCGQAMKVEKNGVVAEALSQGEPYYKVRCDRYRCPSCGVEVLTGFGTSAVAEHHEEHYGRVLAQDVFELSS